MVLRERGVLSSIPVKNMAKPNLVITVVFFIAMRLWGGPWGWCISHKEDGVRWIKGLMFDGFNKALPLFPRKKDGLAKVGSLDFFWSLWGPTALPWGDL